MLGKVSEVFASFYTNIKNLTPNLTSIYDKDGSTSGGTGTGGSSSSGGGTGSSGGGTGTGGGTGSTGNKNLPKTTNPTFNPDATTPTFHGKFFGEKMGDSHIMYQPETINTKLYDVPDLGSNTEILG
jgi:hypothetical protein